MRSTARCSATASALAMGETALDVQARERSLTSRWRATRRRMGRHRDGSGRPYALGTTKKTDERIRTADAAYRAVLRVKRVADAVAAEDQAVADAFASVNARFRSRFGAKPGEDRPAEA